MSDDTLKIHVHVSPRAAILAGKTVVGKRELLLKSEELSAMPEAQRVELALAFEVGEVIGNAPDDPPMAEPTVAALQTVLAARAEARAKRDGAERVEAARKGEVEATQTRKLKVTDQARTKALRVWVEQKGDDDHKARYAEGFLREEEILDAVAEDLIDIRGFSEYSPMHKGEVCECACAGAVVFTMGTPQHMDSHEFAKLQEVRDQLPDKAIAESREHRGSCPACKCLPTVRITALVTLPWEGWALKREFLLK